MVMNLVDADFKATDERNLAIGKRVEVVFMDIDDTFTLPQLRLVSDQPDVRLWQFPG